MYAEKCILFGTQVQTAEESALRESLEHQTTSIAHEVTQVKPVLIGKTTPQENSSNIPPILLA